MRFRKSGSTKGSWDPAEMQRAVEAVMNKSMSERKAADVYNIKRLTLKRRLTEQRKIPGNNGSNIGMNLSQSTAYNNTSMKIFANTEEIELVDYCLRASKMGYRLSLIRLRQLAYEYAEKFKKRLPHSRRGRLNPWDSNKQAGEDWFRAFMRRHKGPCNKYVRKEGEGGRQMRMVRVRGGGGWPPAYAGGGGRWVVGAACVAEKCTEMTGKRAKIGRVSVENQPFLATTHT